VEEDIRPALEALARIADVRLTRDRQTGESRGLCFVDFASVDDARAAMSVELRILREEEDD
ncbi:hypothetical protein T484DRAFT_1830514, partial [Baffinella frigidus]